jgi:hypothetical protein
MHANPILDLKKEDLSIAHRQWIRANRVKQHYEAALAKTDKDTSSDITRFYISDAGVFMFLWYSLTYSVIEFLENKGAVLAALDDDFDTLKNGLRRSRNSIFHAEKEYWDKRQIDLIAQPKAGQRIRQIHDTLGGYLLEAMKASKS